jgi:hypothetical protein
MSIERGPKKPEFIEVEGGKIRVGDKVKIVTLNGVVEGDWTLKSFGKRYAVVGKEGTSLRRVVPLREFISWQRLPESPRHLTRQYTPSRPEELKKGPSGVRPLKEGYARALSKEDLGKLAKQLGIDTSDPNWQEKLNKKIRKMTGA